MINRNGCKVTVAAKRTSQFHGTMKQFPAAVDELFHFTKISSRTRIEIYPLFCSMRLTQSRSSIHLSARGSYGLPKNFRFAFISIRGSWQIGKTHHAPIFKLEVYKSETNILQKFREFSFCTLE